MAIKNPRKQFNFRISILPMPELPVFSVQKVTLGDSQIDITEHGFGNTTIKTAGLIKAGNLTIERLMEAANPDIVNQMFSWHWTAQNPAEQAGGIPDLYKRIIRVDELGVGAKNKVGFGAIAVVNTWYAIGAWPATINGREYDRMSSDNLIESIEFSIDYISLDLPPEGILIPSIASV